MSHAPPSSSTPSSHCTRAIARQGTSAVANPGPPPEDDDPLLAFAPYLHVQPRSNAITPDRQRRFIATLAATGIVSQAARSIGKSMEALYKLRARPGAEGFAHAWDEALERGVQRLEDCALQRAMQGTPTPIVSGGKLLGTWDKPDNTLLRFLLQHRLPGRYGLQQVEPGSPIYESVRLQVLAEQRAKEPDIEDVRQEILRKVEAMERHGKALALARREVEVAEEHEAWLAEGGAAPSMPAGDWSEEPDPWQEQGA